MCFSVKCEVIGEREMNGVSGASEMMEKGEVPVKISEMKGPNKNEWDERYQLEK